MLKKNKKRILSLVLSATMAITAVWTSPVNMNSAEAASTYVAENLLVNPDFESETAFSPAGSSHLGNWFFWQNASKTSAEKHSGDYAVVFNGNQSSLEQDVTGLQAGMTYVYTVWAKLSSASDSTNHVIGVKNYGGDELKQKVNSTEWKQYTIEFTYTSGNPRMYGWVDAHGGIDMYMDDACLTVKSDIKSMSITNGTLTVVGTSQAPGAADFSATYSTSLNSSDVQSLTFSNPAVEGNTLTMSFPEVAKAAVEQTVTVNVTYKGQTITLDYVVEASGETEVVAALTGVEATNGTVRVDLDQDPTVKPVVDDFTWEYKINDNAYQTLNVSEFVYNAADSSATAKFDAIRGIPTDTQNVTVKVTYKNVAKESAYVVEKGTSSTFYVDATNGKDTNDGLSAETAFASIDKLNTITFLPGDQILFKKGETFVGCFKPQGSGVEGAPITIGSYGDGEKRPVLQPGENWTVSHIMSANAMVKNAKVNYVIQFYNVEYWEVSDLEIMDPNSEAYLDSTSNVYIGKSANDVYRSGITIQAEDIGTLEHIYVDNVIVHGFHGPGTNIGKTSGGITMNVITNQQRNVAQSTKTQINDIRITNCEIYDVGRSGINFLTPWSFREDSKWGPFNYGTRGYDYTPYEDFYMANNYIHDIDGDGTIIDNCADAVCENNLVTRCSLRPETEGGGASVGLFNWNSDDTYFQFNEVYDIRNGAGSTACNDSQGIEIDALNDRTWVQYNYVHDNMGGFMMYCNVGDAYRSFDGIVRYNISQNDYTHPRQGLFDIYAANYGTEIYNNTFYFTERALKPNSDQIFLFSSASAYETMKFYNNIFYYDGETPAAANTFADGAIDWQSNIFYGFTNLPQEDNAGAPNLSVDPKLVNIGQGGTGTYPGEKVDLSCYYTTEDSPARNAGVTLENNGGRDYFGNKVTGIPDIGAYESGSVALKIIATGFVVDDEAKTITLDQNEKVSVDTFLQNIFVEDGVKVTVTRGSATLTGGVHMQAGDKVVVAYGDDSIAYTVATADSGKGNENTYIPTEALTATAGSAETASEDNKAANAIDGNLSTIWHTAWDGAAAEDRYITLEVTGSYDINGYVYTPRTSQTNGIITKYQILVSNDNTEWTQVASGTWASDNTVKTVMFDEPVQAKYVKLLAVESVKDFASAAEVGLIGNYTGDSVAPQAPVLSAAEVTQTSVALKWTKSADTDVVEYQLKQNGEVIATFDASADSYTVMDLTNATEYKFALVAVDENGNVSDESVVTVTTKDTKPVEPEQPDVKPAATEADKQEAKEYLEDCKGFYTKDDFESEEAWTAYQEAVAALEELLAQGDMTKEDLQAAIDALADAIPEEADGPTTDPEDPEDSEVPEDSETPDTDDSKDDTVQTGDAASVMMWTMLFAMAAVIVILRKRSIR